MKHVHIVAHAEGDKSGEPRYVGAVMDVTKRKRAEEELATRQGQLEEAQALAHLGSWNWDIPTGSLTWSEELYRVFGVTPMEFCPTHELFLEHLHPDDRPVFKAAIEGALSTRSPYDYELRIVRADRSLRILHSRGRVIFDGNGKPLRMIGTAQDITEGKRAHKELAKRAQQQVAVAELSQRALTADNLYLLLNEAVAAITETLGVEICSALELLPGGDAFLVKAGVGWAPGLVGSLGIPAGASSPAGYTLLRNEPVVFGDLEHETRFKAPPELTRYGILSGAVVTIAGRDRPFGALHALSTSRRVFARDDLHFLQSVANIVATAIQRQAFEKEILEITESEQRRIGQDLHDDLCQHLAGIQLMGDVLQRDLWAKAKPEAEQAGLIAGRIRDAIAHPRMLARGLSPVALDSNGLTAALQELAENSGKLFQIKCEFRFDSFVTVDDNAVATHLYRIAQEAVTNAVKHGRAKKVVIRLAESEDECSLTITDDGVGLPETSARDQGTGLRIMKYRAATIGASLEVRRAGEQGTRVSCSFHKQPRPKDR